MFLLVALLSLCVAVGNIDASQAAHQFTLSRKCETIGNTLSLKTQLVRHKTNNVAYSIHRFKTEKNINSEEVYTGGEGGYSPGSFDKIILRRIFTKARQKFLNETAEPHLEAILQALKEPAREFHFDRTDLPDEPASPLEIPAEEKAKADETKNNPVEKINSPAAANSIWGWCTIL